MFENECLGTEVAAAADAAPATGIFVVTAGVVLNVAGVSIGLEIGLRIDVVGVRIGAASIGIGAAGVGEGVADLVLVWHHGIRRSQSSWSTFTGSPARTRSSGDEHSSAHADGF